MRIPEDPSRLEGSKGSKNIESPTPITNNALKVRCLISVGLNQKALVVGRGPNVILYS